LILVDKKGVKISEKLFGGAKDDKINALCQMPTGDIYAVGYTMSKGKGLKDAYLVKLSIEGKYP